VIFDFRFGIDSTDKSRGGYHMKKFLVIIKGCLFKLLAYSV